MDADRKRAKLGTIMLNKPVADSATAGKALLFLPSSLTDDIEMSDDPLVNAQVQACGGEFRAAAGAVRGRNPRVF